MSTADTHVEGTTTDDALLHLDNQLCFALHAAARAISRTYRERLGPMGLTYPQYLVLVVLWEEDGLTVTEIGSRLLLDSGTLTPLLKRLEAMEVLTRTRGEADERHVLVHLTEAGRALRAGAGAARRHVVCRLAMSDTEIAEMRASLIEVVNRLERSALFGP